MIGEISDRVLGFLRVGMYSLSVLMIVMGFISLGLTGSNYTIWQEIQTPSYLDYIRSSENSFFVTQQLLIAFDVLIIPACALLIFSTFRFYTKGNLIIIIFYSIIFLSRWAISIAFLTAYPSLRNNLNNQYDLIKDSPLCSNQSCSSSINYVICGKIKMWRQLQDMQIAYCVICVLAAVGQCGISYVVNKVQVQKGQMQNL